MGQNTYVAVGNKNDVADLVTNIAPVDTPFTKMCGKGKTTAVTHSWMEDDLEAPGANAKVEGATFTVDAPNPRAMKENYTQIMSKGYGVTESQEVAAKYGGVSSEIGYQMAKAMKKVARDMEYAFLTNATRSIGSATTARTMGGAPYFITTNVVALVGAAGAMPALTEAAVNEALQDCWQAGGTPSKVFLSGNNKRQVSAWSGEGEKYLEQNSKKLVNSISVYESDFGIVSFVPHRMMNDNTVFVIDPEYWKIAYYRTLKTLDLPKDADMEKKTIIGELTLEARAEKANAKITLTQGAGA
ncbi:hypothetical protein FACS1894204_06210 [Synergistales bacterium]|nr:hypothetical protein FACS1894204_06210 [Synergistales bacterium]